MIANCGNVEKLIIDNIQQQLPEEKILSLLEENPRYKQIVLEMKEERKRKERLTLEVLHSIPEDITELYPVARQTKRHFILHVGPTNSGKTYAALQALKESDSGVYLAPLRLMAYETYERLNDEGILCNMITGEEEIKVKDAKISSMTIEFLNLGEIYDTIVIDEAQMINDTHRGGAWTNAILGAVAGNIHICLAPEAELLICELIKFCEGDTFEVIHYDRKTPLICDKTRFHFPRDVRKNDALIVFSKAKVIACAAELQNKGVSCSVIYGNLPYETRHNEVKRFVEGKTDVVVSTDAIGMGMNIPVERIVFLETEKYDGIRMRPLTAAEMKQIAGRAGRYGKFDTGYYNAELLKKTVLQNKIEENVAPLNRATIGFPKQLLSVQGSLTEILNEWKKISLSKYFWKQDLTDMEQLVSYCEKFTDDKTLIYRLATTPLDIQKLDLLQLFETVAYDVIYEKEILLSKYYSKEDFEGNETLEGLEQEYKILDLLYNLFRKFSDKHELADILMQKKEISNKVTNILAKQALEPKRCKYCNRMLPWNYPYGICQNCHDERYHPKYYNDDYDFDDDDLYF